MYRISLLTADNQCPGGWFAWDALLSGPGPDRCGFLCPRPHLWPKLAKLDYKSLFFEPRWFGCCIFQQLYCATCCVSGDTVRQSNLCHLDRSAPHLHLCYTSGTHVPLPPSDPLLCPGGVVGWWAQKCKQLKHTGHWRQRNCSTLVSFIAPGVSLQLPSIAFASAICRCYHQIMWSLLPDVPAQSLDFKAWSGESQSFIFVFMHQQTSCDAWGTCLAKQSSRAHQSIYLKSMLSRLIYCQQNTAFSRPRTISCQAASHTMLLPSNPVSLRTIFWMSHSKCTDYILVLWERGFYYASAASKSFLLYFARDMLGITSDKDQALLLAEASLSTVGAAILGGVLSSVLFTRTFIRSQSIACCGSILLAIGTQFWVCLFFKELEVKKMILLLFFAVYGFGKGSYMSADLALGIATMPDPDEASRYMGLWGLSAFLGAGLGGFVMSVILELFGDILPVSYGMKAEPFKHVRTTKQYQPYHFLVSY